MFRKFLGRNISVCAAISYTFISSPLLGEVTEDKRRMEEIHSSQQCLDTLRDILIDLSQKASPNSLQKGERSLRDFFSLLTLYPHPDPNNLRWIAWDLYPTFVKAYSELTDFPLSINPLFTTQGFLQGQVDESLNQPLLSSLNRAKPIPFSTIDCDPHYLHSDLDVATEETLNRNHTYLMLEEEHFDALRPILSSLKTPIAECLGSPWRVVNIRAWETHPQSEEFGPSGWHLDGFPTSALKIMFYPLGASAEKGSTELLPVTGSFLVEGGEGTWLLFKNSEILHRGVAPLSGKRVAIEITIIPSLDYELEPFSAGQNARHPLLPWQKASLLSQAPLHPITEIIGINIGGGPYWSCPGWLNLEEVSLGPSSPPFRLTPNCKFPVQKESLQTVYTSHALEHLNQPTAYRVLSEAYRTLREGGDLIIKIPDYDAALDHWLRRDISYFQTVWNMESLVHLWKNRGVCDCLDHRAAMLFCSFYNDAYGNPFGCTSSSDPSQAYFGPPVASPEYLSSLIQNKTPFEIAKELSLVIRKGERGFHFSHQIAWGKKELAATLTSFGFEVISLDRPTILTTFAHIPGIPEMRDYSLFCWAKKKAQRQ